MVAITPNSPWTGSRVHPMVVITLNSPCPGKMCLSVYRVRCVKKAHSSACGKDVWREGHLPQWASLWVGSIPWGAYPDLDVQVHLICQDLVGFNAGQLHVFADVIGMPLLAFHLQEQCACYIGHPRTQDAWISGPEEQPGQHWLLPSCSMG